MLRFSEQNAKIANLTKVPALTPYLSDKRKVYSLDLSSGYSCPSALICKSMAVIGADGKATIKDGPSCQFRCFSASQEVLFPALRKLRADNFAAIKSAGTVENITNLILQSLPSNAGIIRLHVGGDVFSLNYMKALIRVAESRPDVLFYFYTKSINFLAQVGGDNLASGVIRKNLLVTASRGGAFDYLIDQLGIRTATVVYAESEANGLPIDHTDEYAATPGSSFCLLLHGTQPKNSQAARALSALRGKGSYSRK